MKFSKEEMIRRSRIFLYRYKKAVNTLTTNLNIIGGSLKDKINGIFGKKEDALVRELIKQFLNDFNVGDFIESVLKLFMTSETTAHTTTIIKDSMMLPKNFLKSTKS